MLNTLFINNLNFLYSDKAQNITRKIFFVGVGIVTAMMLISHNAMATGGEAEFGEIYQRIVEWMQGYVGKIVSVLVFLIGGFVALVRQSLFFAVMGIGIAVTLYAGPGIIDSIMDAAIAPNANIVVSDSISNGLY